MITATSSSSSHCLCRNVRYRFGGPRTWACFCHCEECRRNCAAPIVAYIGVPLEGFRWQVGEQEGTEPAFYPSSQKSSASSATNAERPWHSRQNIIRAKFIFMPLPSKILKISSPAFMCITGESYHGFIWTIHYIAILGMLLLIGTNTSSCQSPSMLGFQLNQNEKYAYGTWPSGSGFQTAPAP